MSRHPLSRLSLFTATLWFAVLPAAIGADEYRIGDLIVARPWSRTMPAVAVTGAAYFTLSNRGASGDRLIAAASPVAERVEIHEHSMSDGVMRMRHVPGVDVSPGLTTVFEPGGLHIMLMGLHEPLLEGKTFPLTLTFERAGSLVVMVIVEQPAKTAWKDPTEHHSS
ncbi:MAG: copper chaperone PCu(A)C [Gammaproteobacteria bacterium]|nr:copper chaperone PCu(A)C [Gammaproteobacteria bacterium]